MRTLLLAATLLLSVVPGRAHDWNDGGIAWQPYDKGLAAAKADKKPVCLVVFTEWCPHCANYSKVFHDPKVIEKSKKFVMIHLDKDKNGDVTKNYAPDGEYIPRTLFLSSDGKLDADLHAPRDKYKYFYDESNPSSVLAGMDAALAKLK
jgi:thioredoxin family protein